MGLRLLKQSNQRKVSTLHLWKLILGCALTLVGCFFFFLFLQTQQNILVGFLAIVLLLVGGLFLYLYFSAQKETGIIDSRRQITGSENASIWVHRRINGNLVPKYRKLRYIKNIPSNAVRRWDVDLKRYIYELLYNPDTRRLEPFYLPEPKGAKSTSWYATLGRMDIVRQAMKIKPENYMDMVKPGLILIAMIIVGILMVITTSPDA